MFELGSRPATANKPRANCLRSRLICQRPAFSPARVANAGEKSLSMIELIRIESRVDEIFCALMLAYSREGLRIPLFYYSSALLVLATSVCFRQLILS